MSRNPWFKGFKGLISTIYKHLMQLNIIDNSMKNEWSLLSTRNRTRPVTLPWELCAPSPAFPEMGGAEFCSPVTLAVFIVSLRGDTQNI